MPITPLPTPPCSRTRPSTFSVEADARLAAENLYITQANALEENVNAKEASATAQAAAAAASAVLAQQAAVTAFIASSGYLGPWADQGGAGVMPMVVSHDARFWHLTENVADVTAHEPGVSAVWLVIGGYFSRINRDQDDNPVSVTVADLTGFFTFTNTGATGETVFNLPAGMDGMKLNVIVTAAQYMKFVANGTEVFRYRSSTSAAGGYIRSNVVGTCFSIEWDGTQWLITNLIGTLKNDA